MRYKYSELTPEQLKKLEAENIHCTREWGPDKDPKKDPPDFIEFGRAFQVALPRWVAIRQAELADQNYTEEEIFEIIKKEHAERNKPDRKVQITRNETIAAGPNGEVEHPQLTEEQEMWINYLATICRMAGVNPEPLTIQQMVDISVTANVNVIPFEEYVARQKALKEWTKSNDSSPK